MGTKNNISVCPACGQKIVDYKHNLNKTLVSCLWCLHNAGGCARLDILKLDNTQFTNFQKLRYFNLIVPTNKHSEWQITKTGTAFLQGKIAVPRFVITRQSQVIERSSESVFIQNVKECINYKIEWKSQATQPTLFD